MLLSHTHVLTAALPKHHPVVRDSQLPPAPGMLPRPLQRGVPAGWDRDWDRDGDEDGARDGDRDRDRALPPQPAWSSARRAQPLGGGGAGSPGMAPPHAF